jgi:hypothetical protein
MPKQQKVTVQVQVSVPEGTSKTKVEKAVSTLLKSGNAPDGFKLGAPKVVPQQTSTPASEPALA